MGFLDDVKNASTNTNLGTSYTYGIDKTGQMYIFDQGANKMVYYGDVSKGAADLYVYQNEGHTIKSEGDQRTAATAPASKVASTAPAYTAPAKVLDQAGVASIDSLLSSYDQIRNQAKQKAQITRDTSLKEKQAEKKQQEDTYNGKKLTTLQDFSGAKTDTDINTRDTLENLVSSLSTLGLGGSRALTRQILDNANRSNRKANATQATNNQSLDTAFNDYSAGEANDEAKINDQFGYDSGEADRTYNQNKQTALYKKADLYGDAGDSATRASIMNEGNSLNGVIANSAFMNPSYTGETKAMATPDLADYTQDIAQYDTTPIGNVTPVGAGGVPGAAPAGNLAVKAIAVNDKDLGIKKRTEGELGLGV